MKKSIVIFLLVLGALGIAGIVIGANLVSFSNHEIALRNSYEQKFQERTAFYDKMWKIFSQKSQVALQNDSSFRKNVDIIMSARAEGNDGALMKWITETNPNANYETVSIIYQDLSRAIEAQREGFFTQEKTMQDIQMQHKDLLLKFPGSLYNVLFNRELLVYKAITSDRTDEVIKTGKDNDVGLFQ